MSPVATAMVKKVPPRPERCDIDSVTLKYLTRLTDMGLRKWETRIETTVKENEKQEVMKGSLLTSELKNHKNQLSASMKMEKDLEKNKNSRDLKFD